MDITSEEFTSTYLGLIVPEKEESEEDVDLLLAPEDIPNAVDWEAKGAV